MVGRSVGVVRVEGCVGFGPGWVCLALSWLGGRLSVGRGCWLGQVGWFVFSQKQQANPQWKILFQEKQHADQGAKTCISLRVVRAARDPLRGSAWSRYKNWPENFFCDFQPAHAKTVSFCGSCVSRAALCGDRRGQVAKTKDFVAIPAVSARPSAGIARVGRLPLWSCANLRGLRATLFEDCAYQIALAVVPCESSHIFAVCARPSAGIRLQSRNF